jgi:hypothetical protein
LPFAHILQAAAPAWSPYLPAAQSLHIVPPFRFMNLPTAHILHAVTLACATWSLYLPPAHGTHAAASSCAEKVPAAQCLQPSMLRHLPAAHGVRGPDPFLH